jgi:putative ABC transport system substrate-binding protein
MVYNLSAYANQNISGVLIETPVEMRIAGIKKAFPNIKKISMLYSQNSIGEYKDISSECTKQGLTLIAKEVNSEQEFGDALNSVLSGTDCFLMSPDGKIYFSQSIKMLFLESNKRKIPVIGLSSFFTKAGAAMSFDSDYKDLGRQAAELASKIIAGEKITGLKSVRPRKCVYSLNLGTAERIGITFPQNVIKEAAEVFN